MGLMLDRNETGVVGPVFKESPFSLEQFLEKGPPISIPAGAQGEMMSALQDVDGVELDIA